MYPLGKKKYAPARKAFKCYKQMDHKCNKALISNENRSYLKERRPKTRKIKKRFHYKCNLIGRAPHLLETLQPLLIVLIKTIGVTLSP